MEPSAAAAPPKSVLPFLILIFVLTLGAAGLAKGLDRQAVMAAWADRRCEVPIMAAAALFKPADDPRSAAAFSAANFSFCMKEAQKKSMGEAMQPVYDIFRGQLGASGTVAESLNSLRGIMATVTKDTTDILLSTFYEQFKRYAYAAAGTMQRLRLAFNRITGATQAMLYAALSTVRSILNAIDFIMLVVVIVVTILAIIFIILFFFLFPYVPIILIVISLLVGAGVQVGHLRNTFCFAPQSLVYLASGETATVASLTPGTWLAGGGTVTGMYVFDGTQTPLRNLSGIFVAEDHLVADGSGGWVYVKDHPAASSQSVAPHERLYCPVVTNRRLCVAAEDGTPIWFRDWEEVDDAAGESLWARWVWEQLNGRAPTEAEAIAATAPKTVAAMRATGYPAAEFGGRVPDIGELVPDKNGIYTLVIGKYIGSTLVTHRKEAREVCNWELCEDGVWRRCIRPSGRGADQLQSQPLYHLITESGTFMIGAGEKRLVRDATEVGWARIGESYEMIEAHVSGSGGGRP